MNYNSFMDNFHQADTMTILIAEWTDMASHEPGLGVQIDNLPSMGGSMVSKTSNSIIAAWGEDETRLDDPERAIRFALMLRQAITKVFPGSPLPIQIGISTGPKEECIERSRRLLQTIPDGGIVLSQDTHQLVEGIFTVRPHAQLPLPGSNNPVPIYLLVNPKPLALRLFQHGIEGVVTRLIGREIEMKQVRDAFESTMEDRKAQLVLVLGEPGVGKSRLLLEVERWRDLLTEGTWVFRGRANPEMVDQPYALLRDLFRFRFQIQENDSGDAAFEKLSRGVEQFLGPGHLEDTFLYARLLGLPCPSCPPTPEAVNAAQFEQRALRSLAAFFRAVAAKRTDSMLALYIEDAQWADDKSLDALSWFVEENSQTRILILVFARPEILDRRSRWGNDLKSHTRIELRLLSNRDARRLVKEILQKVPVVPDELRDWIADRSGGNPLYIEELVKTLISNQVILKQASGSPWQIDLSRLSQVRVPENLIELLQNRLYTLPATQRTILQRASVIGRVFWENAIAELQFADSVTISIPNSLAGLVKRDIIFRRDSSAFANIQEYGFINNLMHEATYNSIPKAVLRRYHACAAEWFVAISGERLNTLASTIAYHYEKAQQGEKAVTFLAIAAADARRLNAYIQAKEFLQRAVKYAANQAGKSTPSRSTLQFRLGEIMILIGEYANAEIVLNDSLQNVLETGDEAAAADVLSRLGWSGYYRGNYAQAREWLEKAVSLARKVNNTPALLLALRQLGNVVMAESDSENARNYYEESLRLANSLNDAENTSSALNNLGVLNMQTRDFSEARRYLEEALALSSARDDQLGAAFALENLGITAHMTGDYVSADRYHQQVIEMSHVLGSNLLIAEAQIWLVLNEIACGNLQKAWQALRGALQFNLKNKQQGLAFGALVAYSRLAFVKGKTRHAVALLSLALAQPDLDDLLKNVFIPPYLAELQSLFSGDEFESAVSEGQTMDVNSVLDTMLQISLEEF